MLKPIVISGGDPAGIAPEIILKIASRISSSRFPVVYLATAGEEHIEALRRACAPKKRVTILSNREDVIDRYPELARRGSLIIVDLQNNQKLYRRIKPGEPSAAAGRLALLAMDDSCRFIKTHHCRGLLTAPLSKEWVVRGGEPGFSGHTGYLADYFKREVIMLMHGKKFSVIPLTVHIPLTAVKRELKRVLTKSELDRLLQQISQMKGFKGQKIALCGVNPHAGEGGYIGREEVEFLNQKVRHWRKRGLSVEGPLPADALFRPTTLGDFRLILGCYHDQVLTPFKALESRWGINCTIGLPFPRSSPAHGTAFTIAGKSVASADSISAAFQILERGELLP